MVQFNHIGVAVGDPEPLKRIFGLLGLMTSQVEEVTQQKVRTHFIPIQLTGQSMDAAGEGYVELLESLDPESTVGKFLEKKGPGVHHLAFSVSKGNLDQLSTKLRAHGVRLVYEKAQKGAQGAWVNFIHPQSAGGLLIEVIELT